MKPLLRKRYYKINPNHIFRGIIVSVIGIMGYFILRNEKFSILIITGLIAFILPEILYGEPRICDMIYEPLCKYYIDKDNPCKYGEIHEFICPFIKMVNYENE